MRKQQLEKKASEAIYHAEHDTWPADAAVPLSAHIGGLMDLAEERRDFALRERLYSAYYDYINR